MKTTSSSPRTAGDVLQVGYWFSRSDSLFEITVWDPEKPLQVEARSARDSSLQTFTLMELFAPQLPTRFAATRQELVSATTTNQIRPPDIYDADTLPTHLLKRADHILHTVEAVQNQIELLQRQNQLTGETCSQTELTRQACQSIDSPVSLSVYYAYRRLCRRYSGDRARLAVAQHRKTFGKTRIDPNVLHFVDTLIRRFYRSNPPLRIQTIYHLAQQLWQHNRHWWLNQTCPGGHPPEHLVDRLLDGRKAIDDLLADPLQIQYLAQIPLPSRAWFYGYIRWFRSQPGEGEEAYILRHGQKDWEENFLLFDQFARTAVLPLQYVFADHYRLDVLHVDDEFREVLGRLWLTVLIDAFSRAVLGLYLAYEDPCIESIQGALRHAIWPKVSLEPYGIDLPWAGYGIPQRLLLDNAWAHHSYSLEQLAGALAGNGQYTHLELVFRPPYQARYGALVERLFGNLSGQIRELMPGAILRPDQRKWHNANQGACLLYRDVIRLVNQLVVDYLHTPHQELGGLTPHEKWCLGLQRMAPLPPPFTAQLERTFWRLHPETRIATHEGLALFGLHYWDPALAGLRSPDRQGRRKLFHIRYDAEDVSRVAVFEKGCWLGDGYARELRLADGSFEPVSLWELEMAKDLIRQQDLQQRLRPHSWLVHILEARELIEQRQTEQKLIRRKLQQLREHRRGRPSSSTPKPGLEASQVQETERVLSELDTQDKDPRTSLLHHLEEIL